MSGGMKFGSLEVVRGLAALLVALGHAASMVGGSPDLFTAPFGGVRIGASIAVEIFFVLSGFVMATSHGRDFGNWHALPRYACRRVLRIYPLYLLLLAFNVFLWWVSGFDLPNFHRMLEHVTLLPTTKDDVLAVAWTLRHEVIFYAVLFVALMSRYGIVAMIAWGIAIVLIAIRAETGWPAGLQLPTSMFFQFALHPLNLGFVFGFLAAQFGLRIRWSPVSCLIVGSVALAAIMHQLATYSSWGLTFGPFWPSRVVLPTCCAFLLLALVQIERSTSLPQRVCNVFGSLSYPLYLCHVPVFIALIYLLQRQNFVKPMSGSALFFIFMIIAVATAWLLYLCFDRPIQRWNARLFRGATSAGVVRSAGGTAGVCSTMCSVALHNRVTGKYFQPRRVAAREATGLAFQSSGQQSDFAVIEPR